MEYTNLKDLSEDYLAGKMSEKEFVEEYNKMLDREQSKRKDIGFEPHEHI